MTQFDLFSLEGIGEIRPGDDLAAVLAQAIETCGGAAAGDVVVVTQKIVSKAEGRYVDLADVVPSPAARELAAKTRKDPRLVELVLAEATDVVRAVPHVLITRHRLGFVMANSGIDQSNLGPGDSDRVLLLPVDPDQSAAALRRRLSERLKQPVAVVVTDSFGRPWRHGILPVAIGAAGLPSLHDRRGETDRDGRILGVTQTAIADMVAAAAGLVTGEGSEGIPAAILRGLVLPGGDRPAADLVRPLDEDLFQ